MIQLTANHFGKQWTPHQIFTKLLLKSMRNVKNLLFGMNNGLNVMLLKTSTPSLEVNSLSLSQMAQVVKATKLLIILLLKVRLFATSFSQQQTAKLSVVELVSIFSMVSQRSMFHNRCLQPNSSLLTKKNLSYNDVDWCNHNEKGCQNTQISNSNLLIYTVNLKTI